MTRYGIYEVTEEYDENGLWKGFKCSVVDDGVQKYGKLYIKSDGREHYKAKPKDEELEI